jgi:hypothetical protein
MDTSSMLCAPWEGNERKDIWQQAQNIPEIETNLAYEDIFLNESNSISFLRE